MTNTLHADDPMVGTADPRRPQDRPRAVPLASFLLGAVALAMSVMAMQATLAIGYAAWALRDDDGYYMSRGTPVSSESFAYQSDEVLTDRVKPLPALLEPVIGRVKVEVRTADDHPVFVGIASTAQARRLSQTLSSDSDAVRRSVMDRDIWLQRSSGHGTQSITWPTEPGDRTLVIMNADGTAGVRAQLAVGATAPVLTRAVPWLVAVAGASALAGAGAIGIPWAADRRRRAGR